MTPEEHERLARVESRVDALHTTLKDINQQLMELRAHINKARGMVGGVIFAVSAMWALIQMAFHYIKDGRS